MKLKIRKTSLRIFGDCDCESVTVWWLVVRIIHYSFQNYGKIMAELFIQKSIVKKLTKCIENSSIFPAVILKKKINSLARQRASHFAHMRNFIKVEWIEILPYSPYLTNFSLIDYHFLEHRNHFTGKMLQQLKFYRKFVFL